MRKGDRVRLLLCIVGILAICGFWGGCSKKPNGSRGIYMLLDTSGTYADELKKAQVVINFLLGTLQPGETLAVGRIDTGSFSEKDIIDKVTFDDRPSIANNQKRAFKKKIDDFVKKVKGSSYTDISGGILQAIDYLNESGADDKYILIFSDLQEELAKGHVRDFPFQLEGFTMIALNVVKLPEDIRDPKIYKTRLAEWQARTEKAKGQWKVVNDLERLDAIFTN
jgi:hypothetical protein